MAIELFCNVNIFLYELFEILRGKSGENLNFARSTYSKKEKINIVLSLRFREQLEYIKHP